MNAPFVVAQAITTGQAASRTIVKLTKPANGQAVSVQLDANTQLDFSGIANDQITLVRVGNQLVILFDNQATLTIPLFFDPNGQPLDGIAIDLGGRIVDGQEFAGLFPITTNQNILPASGSAGGGGDGFGAGDPNVDPLNVGNPLDLLGNEEGTPVTFTINEVLGRDGEETGPVEPGPTAFSQTIGMDEDGDAPFPILGLPDRVPGGPDDDPTAPLIYFGGPGVSRISAACVVRHSSVSVPTDRPRSIRSSMTSPRSTALGLTSGGIPIVWTQVGDNLEGRVGPAPNELVVGVTILDLTTGDFAIAMLRPLDHAAPVDGVADETGYLIDIPFTLTDGNGTQAGGTLTVNVNDDSPDPCNPIPGFVEEGVSPQQAIIDLDLEWGADNFNQSATTKVRAWPLSGRATARSNSPARRPATTWSRATRTAIILSGLTSNGDPVLFTIVPPAFPGAFGFSRRLYRAVARPCAEGPERSRRGVLGVAV